MAVRKSFPSAVASLMAAATLVVIAATPSSAAKPPVDPVPVSLSCANGTYSYVLLQLLDRKENVVGTANLECGTPANDVYVPRNYGSSASATVSDRVIGFSFVEWLCTNPTDPVGGFVTPVVQPLAKKGSTTARCTEPIGTGGSDVTVTIG